MDERRAQSYGGQPFRIRDHVERLYRSLHYARMQAPLSLDDMEALTLETFNRKMHLLGLTMTTTSGTPSPVASILPLAASSIAGDHPQL
jgi:branched-subunit amino acid aminotransferase/4-amino-4-deoxychorismate lyase